MIRRRSSIAVIAGAALLVGAATASAERLVVSLSTHRVVIASNFTGADLTLFGAIEQDAASVGRAGGGHNVVVTVIGPSQATVTWRKEHVFGLWVNASSRTFVDVPSYLAVLSNRPLTAIASPDFLERLRLGLQDYPLALRAGGKVVTSKFDNPYRQAFVQLKTEQQLYHEQANAVTFITPVLFRASIPLPANVAVGVYEVETRLFADGVVVARENTAFEIVKSGVAQFIAESARNHSLLYGFATTLLAFFTGWLGSVVFRRD